MPRKKRGPKASKKAKDPFQANGDTVQTILHINHEAQSLPASKDSYTYQDQGWCKVAFPTPFTNAEELAAPARTVHTKLIFDVRQSIVEKPNWQEKFRNLDIWKKWRKEMQEQLAPKDDSQLLRWVAHGPIPVFNDGDDISPSGWECIQQLLEWQAERIDGPLMPAAVDGAWIADNLVSNELKKRLKLAVSPLENVPDSEKDWHPGSNKQVLDLVHPSLYCLVYGVTRQLRNGQTAIPALKYMGGGDVIPVPPGSERRGFKRSKMAYWASPPADYDTSIKYQWLPSEFDIADDGKTTISSYVNNLHPIKHKQLYFVLEEIFEKFVPMFNKVLRDLARWDPRALTALGDEDIYEPEAHPYDDDDEPLPEGVDEYEEDSEISEVMEMDEALIAAELQADLDELAEELADEPQMVPPDFEPIVPVEVESTDSGDSDDSEDDGSEEAARQIRAVKSEFQPPATDDSIDIRGHRVQVIVKLANIILQPSTNVDEAPAGTINWDDEDQEDESGVSWRYEGGAWHVEGMKNEAIVATGIYYYESENITESRLAFRTVIQDPSSGSWDSGEVLRLGRVYGLDNEMPLNEMRGSIITQTDRMICFPNILQHQVQPFELVDKTKPGYRKILVFFLIDPSKRIISTETVPPQQRDWYGDALIRHAPEIAHLPRELLLQQIIPNVSGCPMSLEEAKKHRKGLMEERKYFVNEYEHQVYQRAISLCEH